MEKDTSGHGQGQARSKDEWVQDAQGVILDMLTDHLALTHAEIEARMCDRAILYKGIKIRFSPHIVSEAIRHLIAVNVIKRELVSPRNSTKRIVEVIVPTDQWKRTSYIAKAVGRKSLLYGRYLKYADTAGEAGEEVLRHSLTTAAAAGSHLNPMTPGYGEVREVMQVRLFGALDSGAWLQHFDTQTGRPQVPIALPIEMKNRRLVLYPIHKEVHQLLAKAAAIQVEHPDQAIVPILTCRTAHPWLFWMAKDLGFLVHASRRQFVSPVAGIDERRFTELKTELSLADLTLVTTESRPAIVNFFRQTIVNQARTAATRWALVAATVKPYADQLRKDNLTSADRQELIRELRKDVEWELAQAGHTEPLLTWSLPDQEEWQDQPPDLEGHDDNT